MMKAFDIVSRQERRTRGEVFAIARRDVSLWPLSIVILVAGTCLVRWPYLDVPISADEGGYATAAYWWARGDTLYENITITRPQGIFVIFRLIEALGLGSVRGIHLFAMAYTLCSTLALLAVASRLWGRYVGYGAAAIFTLAMATPFVQGYSANAELFMALPLLGSLYLLLRADEQSPGTREGALLLLGSGLLGAIALLIKPSGVVALPLAVVWLYRRKHDAGLSWRTWLVAEVVLGIGFLLGLALALIHGLLTVPDRYLDAVLFYRLHQDSVIAGAVDYQVGYFATNSLHILGHLPILLVAPFGLWAVGRHGDRRGRDLLWLWLICALGGTALGGNWFLHYYQQLLPPIAIATAIGIGALLRRSLHPAWLAGQTIAVLGAVLLAQATLTPLWQGVDPARLPEYEPGIAAAGPVATYLRERTSPTDTIYVVYDHADIYYLAERRPAARWLHFRELRWTPGAFDEQVARIANPTTAPRYIAGAQAFDRFGFDSDGRLRAIVARDYTLETTIGGVPIYRRIDRPATSTSVVHGTIIFKEPAAWVRK